MPVYLSLFRLNGGSTATFDPTLQSYQLSDYCPMWLYDMVKITLFLLLPCIDHYHPVHLNHKKTRRNLTQNSYYIYFSVLTFDVSPASMVLTLYPSSDVRIYK